MADLEVDQSNLPRVQEVSQYFSVLEDGALAHNLQEQEIEQYYSSNVQRNQLVQKDIRVAKRLQDEEQQRAQMVHEQTTRQLEQQDSEYARRIQEEIQRTTDEERKREEKDMEIAKRIQEEEEQYVRQSTRCRRTDGRENSSTIGSPNTVRPSRVLFSEEEESVWHSRELSPSPSPSTSDYEADHCEGRSSCNRQYVDNVERRHQPVREPPLRRRSRQSRNSFASQNSTSGQLLRGWDDVVRLIKNDLSEQGYLSYSSEDELFQPVYKLERILSQRQQASEPRAEQGSRLSRHSSMREGSSRIRQEDRVGRMERYKDRGSVRSENRLARLYSSNDCNSGVEPRRVRFQDDRHNFNTGVHRAFGETHVTKELRTCSVRPYRGDVPVERRASFGDVNRTHRHAANGVRTSPSQEIREEVEDRGRFRERGRWEGGSCRVRAEHGPRAHSVREELKWEGRESRRYHGEPSRRRVRSERWRGNQEDRSSTEEEEVDRDRERRRVETRAPRHPQRSLSASCRGRSPGAGQRVNRPSLDLGELRQVLQDEELARRLQEEEEELIRGDLASASPFESPYPQGDFTVAQVAQDEEIARFIQKQEIKAQLRSREPEDCGSAQGFREMTHVCDNRVVCARQLSRERLDSEGLMSPGDELSPEHQPPSPDTLAVQQHPIRNIAEELDPTFYRKYNVLTGQSIPDTCQIQSTSQAALCEEPAFVAPTKRQSDKPGRAKSKEKKEASKSKENCKQQ